MARLVRMSEAAALGLHAMVLMAAAPERPMSIRSAAGRLRVSEAHLSKVMQRLVKEGLVRSTRGRHGGFLPVRSLDNIALRHIYEAIDGRCVATKCLFDIPGCDARRCIMGGVLEKVDNQLRSYLSGTKLSDLADVYRRERGHAKKDNRNR